MTRLSRATMTILNLTVNYGTMVIPAGYVVTILWAGTLGIKGE
jgi:hypothetical protein